MGEIFRAYKLLNRTFKLDLTDAQLFRAEAAMKLDFAESVKFPAEYTKDPERLMAEWEFKATLVPRKDPILDGCRESMRKLTASTIKKSK